jgi:hypothetical protein
MTLIDPAFARTRTNNTPAHYDEQLPSCHIPPMCRTPTHRFMPSPTQILNNGNFEHLQSIPAHQSRMDRRPPNRPALWSGDLDRLWNSLNSGTHQVLLPTQIPERFHSADYFKKISLGNSTTFLGGSRPLCCTRMARPLPAKCRLAHLCGR